MRTALIFGCLLCACRFDLDRLRGHVADGPAMETSEVLDAADAETLGDTRKGVADVSSTVGGSGVDTLPASGPDGGADAFKPDDAEIAIDGAPSLMDTMPVAPDAGSLPPDASATLPAPACANPAPCSSGALVMEADYWCVAFDDPALKERGATWGDCANGNLVGYYGGLRCPFDVAIAHTPGWKGPCDGCIDGVIITNGGGSRSASWKATPTTRYCCDGRSVRSLSCP